MKMSNVMKLLAACAVTAAASIASGQSQPTSPIGQIVPFGMELGTWDNVGAGEQLVYADTVQLTGSAWLRLYFENTVLPDGSYIRMTSMRDGEVQTLDRKSLDMWGNSSAYFNGDTLLVEVIAGANTIGTHVHIKSLGLEMPVQPVGTPGQCGICGNDDRVQTNELWSARIAPVGCTGSVYCNTGAGMVTAGHCIDGQSNLVAQFNVPNSNANCGTVNPPVNDQFPVLPGFQFQNVSPGNDWGVYLTGTNGLGQTPFQRYGQFRPLAAAPSGVGAVANFWGYGLDTNCVRSQTQQFSTGPITGVAADYYDFSADVRGGNSGSGYLNAAGQIIGIVTHCRVGCPNIAQRIDDPAFVTARNNVNPGNCGLGAPPPGNDNCNSAFGIGLGSVSGSTASATNDGTSTCGSTGTSRDVWYSFTPTCTGEYRIDTCGSAFDTVLSLHSGCPGTGTNTLFCDDDADPGTPCSGTLQSAITTTLTAGTPYLIRVGGFNSTANGTFTLNLTATNIPTPANDLCGNAAPLPLGIPVAGDTSCAFNDGAATCVSSTGSRDVWYIFNPGACGGTYSFSTCSAASFDTTLSIHTGCPGNGSNIIACNDDSCGLRSTVSANLAANTNYLIRVGAFTAGGFGSFELTATRGADTFPVNDSCTAASVVGLGTVNGSTTCATNDGTPACVGATNRDVWYAFTPTCGGIYQFDTEGASNYDTALSIHTGCPGTSSNQIACDDDSGTGFLSLTRASMLAGTTYLVRVSGFGSSVGNFQLNISAYTGNDACAGAFPIGNGTTGFNNNAATTDGSPEGICTAFGNNNVSNDVWYTYRATCNGTVTVSTCGSSFDTKVAVYNAAACPVSGPIVCNDDFCGLQSTVSFAAAAGSNYLIRAGGFSTSRGCGIININCATPCPWQADGCFADFNNDEGIDGDDVIAFFAEWDASLICADVNGDDGVDGDDVILFFQSWDASGIGFPGC